MTRTELMSCTAHVMSPGSILLEACRLPHAVLIQPRRKHGKCSGHVAGRVLLYLHYNARDLWVIRRVLPIKLVTL